MGSFDELIVLGMMRKVLLLLSALVNLTYYTFWSPWMNEKGVTLKGDVLVIYVFPSITTNRKPKLTVENTIIYLAPVHSKDTYNQDTLICSFSSCRYPFLTNMFHKKGITDALITLEST